jgi:hypothetical protein
VLYFVIPFSNLVVRAAAHFATLAHLRLKSTQRPLDPQKQTCPGPAGRLR